MNYGKVADHKTVDDLITILSLLPEDAILRCRVGGFPHLEMYSYRGYYEDAMFEYGSNTPTTIGEVLGILTSTLETTLYGWKGGDYIVQDDTPVWLAIDSGNLGEAVTGISIERDGTYVIESRSEDY